MSFLLENLKLSKGVKFRIHDDGKIYGSLSESSGEFYVAEEVFAILLYFSNKKNKKSSQNTISLFLNQHFKNNQNNLPSEKECLNIAQDLLNAGFLVDIKHNTVKKMQNDGFADSWIQWAMIADKPRFQAYEQGIKQKINKDSVVLDVGAGTGLLSACALKNNAKKVCALEETAIAESIVPQLKKLKLFDETKFSLQKINSFDAKIPDKVSHVVSELFGNDPFSEGFYSSLCDLTKRIKNKNVQFIPNALSLYAECINLLDHNTKQRISTFLYCSNFGLQKGASERRVYKNKAHTQATSNAFANQSWNSIYKQTNDDFFSSYTRALKNNLNFDSISFPVNLTAKGFTRLCEPVMLANCSLNPVLTDPAKFQKIFSGEKELNINFDNHKDEVVPVILLWFRVHVTEKVSVSSHPQESDASWHWNPLCVVLNEDIKKSGRVKLNIKFNLSQEFNFFECDVFFEKKKIGSRS